MSRIEEARRKAEEIFEGNFCDRGLMASRDWYNEVFARDSAIAFAGGCLVGKKKIYDALKKTIRSLAGGQSKSGLVPTCILKDGRANFGTIDGTAWLIVLSYLHYAYTNDKAFLKQQYPKLVAAVRCLQANGRLPDDCVWSQECDDWNDDWSNHGQTLFVNSVWQAGLKYMALLASELNQRADSREFAESYRNVRARIQEVLWTPEGAGKVDLKQRSETVHQRPMEQMRTHAKARGGMRHYLAFVSRGFIGNFCDVMSNSMAICYGLAGKHETGRILDYFGETNVGRPFPAAVIYPPVQEGSEHWRDYFYGADLNLPHHYHNGGAWPHCGGFFTAAHVKGGRMAEAAEHLEKLADFNSLSLRGSEWCFPEWTNGQTGIPSGSRFMSWSAGMYIYAYEVLNDPKILDVLDPKL